MNTTKRNLICALILLAGVVLGCRREGEPVVRKVIEAERIAREQAARRAAYAALDEATKKRVVKLLQDGKKFDELREREPAFGSFVKSLAEKDTEDLRLCLTLASLSGPPTKTEIEKCFASATH